MLQVMPSIGEQATNVLRELWRYFLAVPNVLDALRRPHDEHAMGSVRNY